MSITGKVDAQTIPSYRRRLSATHKAVFVLLQLNCSCSVRVHRPSAQPFDFKMAHAVSPIAFKYLLSVLSADCTSRVKHPARWVLREFQSDSRLRGHQGSPQEATFMSPRTCPLQFVQETRTTTAHTA
jgi:hypothetical protein